MAATSWREWRTTDAAERLRAPGPDDDKYSRGVLGVVTGSHEYPGAALLAVEAAMRAGAGMVRYTGPRPVRALVLARCPEVVTVGGRVQAWLLGSGIDPARRSFVLTGELEHALASRVPVVLDAGGLDLVGTHTAPTVITPHARELATLLADREVRTSVEEVRADPRAWAERAAHELGVVVLLKGAVTCIADPDGAAITVTAPTHRLATAGSGDVLGGILGALVASAHEELASDAHALAPLAATAALLHGRAAELAVAANGGGPITAPDISARVPHAIGELLG
ncbi:ADP-dependent NAD(P)H-hydrate dehydratase [Agromyces soli]